ncbi:acyl-CoA thioesterase [Geoalkalibacter halelectricus]|uniref:Acyl-CoA thioesterase n=1 Tax=Geoalkalibacter halelectricus TaxID=2847045 RepID=A0ABY5ZJD4_9BACT|nr:thioesterase family protein [Geoalkalibacter halelectricus]MDO3379797.1 acyl-CoA thioesterase [Geoalkalibacter halelectricus]UWZ79231.1 acyl-CoA thioesterase [Geoalkalibacter halelectricus]
MTTCRMTLRVRYAETDAQGIVHHSRYLVWFEEGRSDFLRQNGVRYTDFEKSGYFVVVVRAELDYKAPAFYEDEITVETTLVRQRGKVLEFSYQAFNDGGVLLATARTVHVVVDRNRKPVTLPAEFLEKLV